MYQLLRSWRGNIRSWGPIAPRVWLIAPSGATAIEMCSAKGESGYDAMALAVNAPQSWPISTASAGAPSSRWTASASYMSAPMW
jgi:hypothetical protein